MEKDLKFLIATTKAITVLFMESKGRQKSDQKKADAIVSAEPYMSMKQPLELPNGCWIHESEAQT